MAAHENDLLADNQPAFPTLLTSPLLDFIPLFFSFCRFPGFSLQSSKVSSTLLLPELKT